MKKIISVFLVVLMLFALTACNGDEMQSKIDELEAKLNEQTQIMEKLIEDGDALKQEKDRLVGELAGMEEARQALEELVGSLEEENNNKHEFIDTILNELVVEDVNRFRKANYQLYSEPFPYLACGYKFLKILYDKEKVKIKFYGCHSIENEVDDEIEPNYAIISILSGYHDEYGALKYYDNETEIKRIMNFEASEYYREQPYFSSVDEMSYLGDLTVPQELFVDKVGFIYIRLRIYYLKDNEYVASNEEQTSMYAYYKNEGSYIILSTEPF